ncbi:MAG: radical SAM protein [Pyrinomonadaceae bacterium]
MHFALLPKFVQFELTYACNSRCVFCYNPSREKQTDEETILKVLHELNRYKLNHVQLIGGEVTVFGSRLPYYLSLLDKVKTRSMVTNGRLFIAETASYLDEVYISIHGDEALHETLTGARNSFKKIENTIRKYVEAGVVVSSDTVLTRLNFDQMLSVCQYAADLGMQNIFVNIFQSAGIGSRSENDLAPTIHEIRIAIDQLLLARQTLPLKVHFGTSTPYCIDERLITEGLAFTCGTGSWFCSINPWGELRICNQSTKSYGNILNEELGRIWHARSIDEEYRSLRWMETAEPCASCVFKVDCLGGCRINDKGMPRIDPIVVRESSSLVSPERLTELYESVGRVNHSEIG